MKKCFFSTSTTTIGTALCLGATRQYLTSPPSLLALQITWEVSSGLVYMELILMTSLVWCTHNIHTGIHNIHTRLQTSQDVCGPPLSVQKAHTGLGTVLRSSGRPKSGTGPAMRTTLGVCGSGAQRSVSSFPKPGICSDDPALRPSRTRGPGHPGKCELGKRTMVIQYTLRRSDDRTVE